MNRFSALGTAEIVRMGWSSAERDVTPQARVAQQRPGERAIARDVDRQVAEPQIRAAILNRFAALGTPQTERAG